MSETQSDPPIQDPLFEEAAAWFARMRGPDAEASRAEFDAWLARGALHRRAYNRASEIFTMGKLLAEPDSSGEEKDRWQFGHRLAAAAIALVLVVGLGWAALTLRGDRSANEPRLAENSRAGGEEQYRTAATERRMLRLMDGSVVRLGEATVLRVAFDRGHRRLTLEQGRARFEVAHEGRPFVVRAGGGTVIARGTIFDVSWTAGHRVSVVLVEGGIDVTLPAPRGEPASPSARRLRTGESLSFLAERPVDNGTMSSAPPVGQDRAAGPAARDYDHVRLADLVAEANHGAAFPIRITDPRIADKRVSGRFRIDDTDQLAERLAALFDLSLEREPGRLQLRSRS